MTAYYNEIDPFAAEWLRNLIAAGHIAPGDVDERDIRDVRPDEFRGYTQCHFFAGIGVWSYALRLAGWPDDRPVWTGSCPCQSFSAAGKRGGVTDERHLWPAWFHLIGECKPAIVFGEQVASKDGLGWLDLVQADLEGARYAVGAADMCAAGIGAPHIRQRLWFGAQRMGDADNARPQGRQLSAERSGECTVGPGSVAGGMEHAKSDGRHERRAESGGRGADAGCGDGGVADADIGGRETGQQNDSTTRHRDSVAANSGDDRHGRPGPVNGIWRDADWLFCRDGKWRPVESGTSPLAHGAPARVGRLRAYGNAIVAPLAAEFIAAYRDIAGVAA